MGRNVVRQVIRGEFLREPSPRCERRNTGTGAIPTARFAEFTADQVLGAQTQKGNTDTMTDMIVGTLGALIVAFALYAHRTRGRFAWLSRFTGA